jgi:hypothetical protein
MDDKKAIAKLNDFFSKEFLHGSGGISIFRNDDGSYQVFNTYTLYNHQHGCVVNSKTNDDSLVFSSAKHAMTWCIFEKRNKIQTADRIAHLDRMITGIDVSIEMHRKLIKKTKDLNSKIIYLAKLTEEQEKRKLMIKEFDRYVNDSKIWQIRQFGERTK